MKQFFSRELWWQGVKKIRVPGIAMAITIIVINLLFPVLAAGNDASRMEYFGMSGGEPTIQISTVEAFSEFAPLLVSAMAFAPLLAFVMFSYLNDRGKSDFYHSIPQTRLCVFVSLSAAIMTWVVGVLLASTSLNLLLWQMAKYHVVVLGDALYFMLCSIIGALFTMTIAILAMTLTGTLVSNLFVAVVLLLFVRIIALEMNEFLYDLIPVYDFDRSWLCIFSFENYLPWALLQGVFGSRYHPLVEGGAAAILLYTVGITLALLVLAAYLYHSRRSEMANKSAPNRYLQFAYRSAVTLPILLFCVMDIVWSGLDEVHLIWIVIALVVYLLYELATTKRIKTMLRTIPMFFALIGVCALIIGGMYLGKLAVSLDTPNKDRVESISISTSSRVDTYYPDGLPLENKEAISLVIDALEYTAPLTRRQHNDSIRNFDYLSHTKPKPNYTFQEVVIRLKNGRTMYRNIWIETQNHDRIRELYMETEKYRKAYLTMPDKKHIEDLEVSGPDFSLHASSKNNAWIYSSFYEEYNALSEEKKAEYMLLHESVDWYRDPHTAYPMLYFHGRYNRTYISESFLLHPDYFPETFSRIMNSVLPKTGSYPLEKILPVLYSLIIEADVETLYETAPNLAFNVIFTPLSQPDDEKNEKPYWRGHLSCISQNDKQVAAMQETLNSMKVSKYWFDYKDRTRDMYKLTLIYSGLTPLAEGKSINANMHSFLNLNSNQIDLYVMLTPGEAERLVATLETQ